MPVSLSVLSTAFLGYASLSNAQLAGRGFPDCSNGPLKNNKVCDTSADPLTRATALIKAFTLEEKFNNTGSTSPGVPRLGLPAYTWWNEGLHGVAQSPGVNFSDSGEYSYTTSFPQPILMGATFDDQLITAVANVVSTEARVFNNADRAGLDFWTPNINPFKDPRWGRGQGKSLISGLQRRPVTVVDTLVVIEKMAYMGVETPGEDPFHLSSYVHALIDGLQGGFNPKYKKVVATCKHLAAYDMETWNGNFRYQWDAHMNMQDLVEYYLPSFQSCARDSNVGAVMCSYNALNGVPTCADPYLLQTVLRDHWAWGDENEGHWVTSDCDAVQNIFMPHEFTKTREETVAVALKAGVDVNCGTYTQKWLPNAYRQGLFNMSTLDQALIRQYTSLVKLGYFDGDKVPFRSLTWKDVNTPAAQRLAYRAAAEGIVLLKNDGLLPYMLSKNTKIALIGGWANATTQMQGNYAGPAPYLHSPLWALQQTGATVYEAAVPGGQGDPTTNSWHAVWGYAEKADLIVYAGGIDNSVESEGNDRNNIGWTGTQLDMIGSLAQYGKPMVVFQMGGGQIDDTPLINNANISAILWAGYPGQDGGVAMVDILQGITPPAGRLPLTQYPADYIAQIPMTDMSLRPNKTSGSPGRTYQWYTGKPVYEFGYGMHYTNFSANVDGNMQNYEIVKLMKNCHETRKDTCAFKTIDVAVKNTGKTTSDYVTLAFLTGQHGPEPYPNKRLVAYTRLHNITAGATQTARLNITLGSLARVDDHGNTVLYPGKYSLMIDTQPLTTVSFTLTGSAVTLDNWPQPPAAHYQTSDYFVGGYGSTYGGQQVFG